MKTKFCIIFFTLLLFRLNAIEETLIDFSKLDDTTIDFSSNAGIIYSAEEKQAMKVSLSPQNWRAQINSSSRTFDGLTKTYAMQVLTSGEYPKVPLLGIRIFFPERDANAYTEIKPPYLIPSYYDNVEKPDGKGTRYIGKGIIRNVGVIRKIHVRVLGNNYRYSLHLIITNRDGEKKYVSMGYLNFVGWQTLSWVNSNYDTESYKRTVERFSRPYYPDEYPFIRLDGILIQRIDPNASGNFVTMIKDIVVDYDPQFPEIGSESIEVQENTFQIYKNELIDRAKNEMWNVNKRLFGEWLEKKRMDKN